MQAFFQLNMGQRRALQPGQISLNTVTDRLNAPPSVREADGGTCEGSNLASVGHPREPRPCNIEIGVSLTAPRRQLPAFAPASG